MPTMMSDREKITAEIETLEKKIVELKARLPAHSIPPALIIELDDLDKQLSDAQQRLSMINSSNPD